MDAVEATPPAPAAPGLPAAATPVPLTRAAAAAQALLVSGVPTQLLVFSVLFFVFGQGDPGSNRQVSLAFFATLSVIDTIVVLALIHTFLWRSGENPRQVFLGGRPARPDALRGLALVPIVFLAVAGIVLGLRAAFPWLHTVETNPLEGFMRTPLQAAVFALVAIVVGGIREELQRAFILHRFEQRLGGMHLGLVLFTLLFGALHLEQGADAAVAIGCLGLWWGVLYIRHRSSIMPMVNHAGFNALQVVQAMMVKSFGG